MVLKTTTTDPLVPFRKPKFHSNHWGHKKTIKECLLLVLTSGDLGARVLSMMMGVLLTFLVGLVVSLGALVSGGSGVALAAQKYSGGTIFVPLR